MRFPQPRERAALVGLALRRSKRHDAEQSLDELAGLADAAGADVVLKVDSGAAHSRSRDLHRQRQTARSWQPNALASLPIVVIFDNELTPAQLRQIEERVDRKVHRSHSADPRYFRAARTDARRKVAGGARPAQVPVATTRRRRHGALAAWRRHRHARARRNETRDRPPAYSSEDSRDHAGDRVDTAAAPALARATPEGLGAARRAGWVHQRGQRRRCSIC